MDRALFYSVPGGAQESKGGGCVFLNESPKTECIDVIDVEFTILPGQ